MIVKNKMAIAFIGLFATFAMPLLAAGQTNAAPSEQGNVLLRARLDKPCIVGVRANVFQRTDTLHDDVRQPNTSILKGKLKGMGDEWVILTVETAYRTNTSEIWISKSDVRYIRFDYP